MPSAEGAGAPAPDRRRIARAVAGVAVLLVSIAGALVACDRPDRFRDDFTSTPFAADAPRWCERYHHAHFADGLVRLTRSAAASADVCANGAADGRALSCEVAGCAPCDCQPPCSPCSKAGDVNGNAVLMTTADAPGPRRVASATFVIERQMPPGSHVGLYVALHPHCHQTVQGLLVADAPGTFHLNVAAFNQYVGGDRAPYAACLADPFAEISPPLAHGIELREGVPYRWRLAARLADDGRVQVVSSLRAVGSRERRGGRFVFLVPHAGRWFGVAGGAARYAFGAQFSTEPSPSGGEPALALLSFSARPGLGVSGGSERSRAVASR